MKKEHRYIIFLLLLIIAVVFIYQRIMRKKFVVAKAKNELETWRGLTEKDKETHSMLVEYWQKGAGFNWITSENIDHYSTAYAWSAAFICFIMRLEYSYFPQTSTHAAYTVAARERRKAGHSSFIAYEPNEYKPQPGDIVIKKRGYKGDLAGLYDTATTHGDIVIENNGDYLTVIGGNVSNSVRESIVPAKNGIINHSNWIAVIKM